MVILPVTCVMENCDVIRVLIFVSVPEDDPFQPVTTDETVSVGGTVTLTCRVMESDNSSLQWSNTAQQTLYFGDKRGKHKYTHLNTHMQAINTNMHTHRHTLLPLGTTGYNTGIGRSVSYYRTVLHDNTN